MAVTPELVDLKITDCCPYYCPYCYQGSTHTGEHAADPYSWIYALRSIGVFEVAIGGGEPTLHPEFKALLNSHSKDLRINFSTRNIDWVCYNADLVENCGGFAVSVDDYHKTTKILDQLDKGGILQKASLQYVMGTADDFNFEALIKLCAERAVRLTLLGYKLTGRGAKAKKKLPKASIQNNGDWIEIIKKHSNYVAIDTALAVQVPKSVFNETYLRRLEGTHSMYIDAVTNTAGISSYTKKMLPVKPFGKSIVEVFSKLQALGENNT
jgi:organic radical activating enzyme